MKDVSVRLTYLLYTYIRCRVVYARVPLSREALVTRPQVTMHERWDASVTVEDPLHLFPQLLLSAKGKGKGKGKG